MSVITDYRFTLEVYDHKSHLITDIRPSVNRRHYYDAIILNVNTGQVFGISFGDRYQQFYRDNTPHRGLYKEMETNLLDTKRKWLNNHSKWTVKPISARWLEYMYLFK